MADVVGKPLGTVELANGLTRMDRFVAAEPGWELNKRLVDDDGEWVQIGGMRMRSQTLGL